MILTLALLASLQVDCPTVLNLNQQDNAIGSHFYGFNDTGVFVEFQGVFYFLAATNAGGTKVWKTDGTLAGTVPAFDDAGPAGNGPATVDLTVAGSRIFFRHVDPGLGAELYVSDGSAPNTYKIVDLAPGTTDGALDILAAIGNSVVFTGWSAGQNHELWVSDGTLAGTQLLLDIWPGPVSSAPMQAALDSTGSVLYFSANDGTNGRELWRSDGTSGGTYLLKDVNPVLGNGSNPADFFNWGGATYFSAYTESNGVELWKTDGTSLGTVLVKDLDVPGDGQPQLSCALDLGGQFVFSATKGTTGKELWISDGTEAGTQLWLDVNPGPAGSDPQLLAEVGGRVLFFADSPASAGRLLSFDGINVETLGDLERPDNLFDMEPPPLGVALNSFYYLSARSAATGEIDLWATTGDNLATVLVKDFEQGQSSEPLDLVALGSSGFLFTAKTTGTGRELFMSDGTPNGTSLVIDLEPTAFPKSSNPAGFEVVAGERLYFAADDGVHGTELWTRDPSGSLSLLRDIDPNGSGFARNVHAHWDGNAWRTFFIADDGVHGDELWSTDGTTAGTQMVVDLLPGGGNGASWTFAQVVNERHPMGSLGGEVFFAGIESGATGIELFATDGTAAGTRLVRDLIPGPTHSYPDQFVAFDGALYFVANANFTGSETLWKTDGTTAGTVLIASADGTAGRFDQLTVAGDALFFSAVVGSGSAGRELYALPAGGVVTLVDDHASGPASGMPAFLTAFDGRLVYTASNGVSADLMVVEALTLVPQVITPLPEPARLIVAGESWLTFGAAFNSGGPQLLGRWDGVGAVQTAGMPVIGFSNFGEAVSLGDDVVFVGADLAGVRELYQVDAETGSMTKGCSTTPLGTSPADLTLLNGELLFSGYSDNFGQELMQLDLDEAQALDLGPSTAALALAASAPHLGGNVAFAVEHTSLGAPGFLAWSLTTPAYATPLVALGGAAWLDSVSIRIVNLFIGGGPVSINAAVPATPALLGLTVQMQAFELPGGAFPANASNGVALTLGL